MLAARTGEVENIGTVDGVSIPILPARDLRETRAFYERLGFVTGYWSPEAPDGYAIFTRGTLEMHFFLFPEVKPSESFAGCYWRVSDADPLHAEFAVLGLPPRGIPRMDRIENKPWNMREFAIIDPNGNLVRIGHVLK